MARILVVEDEALIRMLIVDTLEEAGHSVAEAADGEAALSMMEAMDDLALVISDIRMPRIDGYELGLAIRRLRPKLPLLFITGYAKEAAPQELADIRVILKPFDSRNLESAVHQILAAGQTSPPD